MLSLLKTLQQRWISLQKKYMFDETQYSLMLFATNSGTHTQVTATCLILKSQYTMLRKLVHHSLRTEEKQSYERLESFLDGSASYETINEALSSGNRPREWSSIPDRPKRFRRRDS